MSSIRPDLNLFRVFDAVMRHRSLGASGRELGITASAVSHALRRLHSMLGDDLFVASQRGMMPTERALELAPTVAGALEALRAVLASKHCDPATTGRIVRIGASDHSSELFLPGLVDRVLRNASGMRLHMMPISRADIVKHLDERRLDLAVSWLGETPGRIRRRPLFLEREALVVRINHPLAGDRPDEAALLTFRHLVVEPVCAGEVTPDGFCDDRTSQRRVWLERLLLGEASRSRGRGLAAITVPTFSLVAPLLRSTDLIATLPFRLARRLAAAGEVVMLDLPYKPITVTTEVAWHERGNRDPALQWVVEQLAAACAKLEPLDDPAAHRQGRVMRAT